MRRGISARFRTGTLATAVVLLATPVLAQGEGSKSGTEDPTAKSGVMQDRGASMSPGDTTGAMQRSAPPAGMSTGSEAGSGGGQAEGQGSSAPEQPLSDPRANPNTPVSPRR